MSLPPASDEPTVRLGLTFDCRDAPAQARFWALALDYVESPPPVGWTTWGDWLREQAVPPEEWDDVASISPPPGAAGPSISFLAVPEGKTAKNRVHPDLWVSGGRHVEAAVRERRIRARVGLLVEAGARVLAEVSGPEGPSAGLDHVVLADPEGNELCVA